MFPTPALAAAALALASVQGATPEPAHDLEAAVTEAVQSHAASLGNRRIEYVEVEHGWMSTRSLELYRYLNADFFSDYDAPEEPAGDAIAALVATRRRLESAGVELLVVILPTRLNLYPDCLDGVTVTEEFAGYAPGIERVTERLAGAGVEVLDVLPHLVAARAEANASQDEQVYLGFNAHWSPKGVALTARLLADEIESRPWFERPPAPPDGEVSTTAEREVRWGPTGKALPGGLRPQPLVVERFTTADGLPTPRTNRDSPIVLLGDSYSTIYEEHGADFPRHLAHLLGGPVDVIASPGGGPQSSRAALDRRRTGLAGKRLVIWSFSAHSLMSTSWYRAREN